MRRNPTILIILLAAVGCQQNQMKQKSVPSQGQELLDLKIEWPMDAIHMNTLKTTPTETLEEKVRHFEQVIGEQHPDIDPVSIHLTAKQKNITIQGWNCDNRIGFPCVRASLKDMVTHLGDITFHDFEVHGSNIYFFYPGKKTTNAD